MIVALLIVIILILLFGAGVVKGWLANVVGFGCGGLLVLAALLWLGSFFGENGFAYVMGGIGGSMLLLALVGLAIDPNKKTAPPAHRASPQARKRATPKPVQPSPREKIWGWHAHDISLRFSPEAREKARALYDANDVLALDRFLREESARLRK
jgi:hypothetical protein